MWISRLVSISAWVGFRRIWTRFVAPAPLIVSAMIQRVVQNYGQTMAQSARLVFEKGLIDRRHYLLLAASTSGGGG